MMMKEENEGEGNEKEKKEKEEEKKKEEEEKEEEEEGKDCVKFIIFEHNKSKNIIVMISFYDRTNVE
uniref:Uncharacterized protein n=1 Tax=Loa loa TaxID=7209 RepID=A0A1I7V8Z5_LOALO